MVDSTFGACVVDQSNDLIHSEKLSASLRFPQSTRTGSNKSVRSVSATNVKNSKISSIDWKYLLFHALLDLLPCRKPELEQSSAVVVCIGTHGIAT
ncbi:hypothetical protein AVEN_116841-1 [Araneus ventricosus]|uniref:Uncharacterized protein n=1 Tax=Araneus ventricosus TaxID=182803 RepID=A0A4Y2JCQ5_ARAVE|nr:hypothetical protein AVEN_116841-1 [Araneus ventricosus]